MTSQQTIQLLNYWKNINCFGNNKNLWCCCEDKQCWEFNGITSRFVEAHMKGIITNTTGICIIPCLYDVSDFNEFNNNIMKIHPEWKLRLPEMIKYGKEWQRLLKYYDECEQLIKERKYQKVDEIMSGFSEEKHRLYYYIMNETENIKLKEFLIMGSHVPRESEDEFDIYHSCIMDKFPNGIYFPILLKKFDINGENIGWDKCELYHPNKMNIIEEDDLQLTKISEFEKKFCNDFNFNEDKLNYNRKMRELYTKFINGQIINDEEIPNISFKTTKYDIEYINKQKETINKNILEIHKLIDIINIVNNEDITIDFIKNCDIYENVEPIHDKYLSLYIKTKNIKSINNHYIKICNEQGILIENYEDNNLLFEKLFICEKFFKQLYENEFVEEFKLHKNMENYVQENIMIFKNVTYHYSPHYILFDEKDDKNDTSNFKMYAVEIDDVRQQQRNWGIFTCIISISENHILHKKNRTEDEWDKEFNGGMWTISEPIKKNYMYEEGLMNAYEIEDN